MMFDDLPERAIEQRSIDERDAHIVRLRAASPLRPTTAQRATDDLPMFASANEPNLI